MAVYRSVLMGILGILVATACASSSPPQPISGLSSPSTAASSAPSAATSPAPVASEPPVSSLPAFQCADQSGNGTGGAITPVSAVRVGAQQGFDRFVLQFTSAIPSYTVTRQASSTFVNSPRGDQVQLAGSAGVLVTVRPIDWTSYSGTKQ